tara:strand:- start:1040 stop:1246 length:207 start_codon:yes stop_codon:yes gene_type:complete
MTTATTPQLAKGYKAMSIQALMDTILFFAIFSLTLVFVWHIVPAITLLWVLLGLPTIVYFALPLIDAR